MRSISRGVAFDIKPPVMAWRWQSDVASLEFLRIVLVFLGGHSPHVGEPLGAPLFSGVHAEQEGLVPRCARETLQTKESNHIDRVFRFLLHLHRGDSTNTVVGRRTKLHNCETMFMFFCTGRRDKKTTWIDVRKNVCQKSILADLHGTIHGTACGMYAIYTKQLSSYGCLSWEESLETLAKQKSESTRWCDSFDHRGVRHEFWRERRQDETHRKGCEFVPLHREAFAERSQTICARLCIPR